MGRSVVGCTAVVSWWGAREVSVSGRCSFEVSAVWLAEGCEWEWAAENAYCFCMGSGPAVVSAVGAW